MMNLMKKIVNMLLNKKKVIISFVLGVMVAGITSYAVTSMSSDSFSYTRDDQVKSVKQALDELYTKAYNG